MVVVLREGKLELARGFFREGAKNVVAASKIFPNAFAQDVIKKVLHRKLGLQQECH